MAQCTAKSKQTQQQCRQPATQGTTKCRFHGGKSLIGAASPSYKHGRRSKVLPVRLRERYEEALDDAELLAMRDELAVIDARLDELFLRIDTGETGARWQTVRKVFQEYVVDQDDAALADLGRAIQGGVADEQAWNEIATRIQQRQSLVESERRRLTEIQQMMTVGEAVTLATHLLDIVRRNVTDRNALSAIGREFEAALSRPDRQRLTT